MAPRPRFDRLDDDTKRRILDAAAGEFAVNGFDGASYNRIIEQSGTSKGAMYYYFDDKADLFRTTVSDAYLRFADEVGGMVKGAVPGDDFWGEFERLNRAAMAYAISHPLVVGVVKSVYRAWHDPAGAPVVNELFEMARRGIGSILRRGQDLGAVRKDLPDSLLVHLIFGLGQATDMWFLELWPSLDPGEPDDFVQMIVAVYRDVLAPRENGQ